MFIDRFFSAFSTNVLKAPELGSNFFSFFWAEWVDHKMGSLGWNYPSYTSRSDSLSLSYFSALPFNKSFTVSINFASLSYVSFGIVGLPFGVSVFIWPSS